MSSLIYVELPKGYNLNRLRNHKTAEQIVEIVCMEFNTDRSALSVRTRKAEVRQARQVCMYILRLYTKMYLRQIGAMFQGYDYTTVIHSCKTVKNDIVTNGELKRKVENIEQLINK